ncbi:type I-B CRISPR-associated protein Cas7/Cst2/DevR [Spirosoma montaniterrae]|uniref:Type I-B CRISPR-associated protein Cas7/Cst2/DevR n=1 Tax=Spirosoma montaniterrae TaxID=1178516 RepID=A0A1P9WYL0_9BACT|nr:type I-B CRISPR-associated protein Cas7/Cst2/DevR [Spirosoma montaniterrae]AQG80466.1 type I-B CRISPR-associated protein Cas7/Cst2/DevR [Spirosoma montaniterrae]
MKTNSLTITYLSKVSFASLNGGDKEVDNIVTIKKVTLDNGDQLPYLSSQAVRRALRDKLEELGWAVSPVAKASEDKGAAKTSLDPAQYIDDDLFGFMDAAKGKDAEKGKATVRTSPVRVEALLALTKYQEDLDFGTNYMAKKVEGGQPNIFETEIHSGIYRGTILIELDRVGAGEGFEKTGKLSADERAKRVQGLIDAFQTMWSSGRQSRFLADISPKFMAAACMNSKNPIFLEAVRTDRNGQVDVAALQTVLSDYDQFITSSVLATQEGVFGKAEGVVSLKDGFSAIKQWIRDYYAAN